MLQGSSKGETVSPIDDEDLLDIEWDPERVADESSEEEDQAPNENDEEEDQASDDSFRPEDRFGGVWKDVATKTDRERELMTRIIELHSEMTAAASKLDHIVTSETASGESIQAEDVEDIKQAVGDVSKSIKESLADVVKEVGWDFEAMSPEQVEAHAKFLATR